MTDLRCAVAVRGQGADPGGTAGCYDGWALVSCPLPWPADVAAAPGMAEAVAALAELDGRIRPQAAVPVTGRTPAVLHRRGHGAFSGYTRYQGPDVASLVSQRPGSHTSTGVRDVLVCTHGRRDRCCGSLGTRLWQALEEDPEPGVVLWRTSHTGGHRFAPTMVVLPEGTMWGFVDDATARRIVRRQGPVADVLDCYRGCTGLGRPPLQALEKAVLGEIGWPLLDLPRSGGVVGGDRWRLEVGGPDPSVWEADVVPGRRWMVPTCGEPLATASKSDTALDVVGLARTA